MSDIKWIDECKPDFIDSKSQILKDAIDETRSLLQSLESGVSIGSVAFIKDSSSFEIRFSSSGIDVAITCEGRLNREKN